MPSSTAPPPPTAAPAPRGRPPRGRPGPPQPPPPGGVGRGGRKPPPPRRPRPPRRQPWTASAVDGHGQGQQQDRPEQGLAATHGGLYGARIDQASVLLGDAQGAQTVPGPALDGRPGKRPQGWRRGGARRRSRPPDG